MPIEAAGPSTVHLMANLSMKLPYYSAAADTWADHTQEIINYLLFTGIL